ncbi:MAG TPA: SCO family protein [Candidatus Dormibacteraeota bacterium]|nr:SCO family protein [Candidatus Dormibacteraeota bacterium]
MALSKPTAPLPDSTLAQIEFDQRPGTQISPDLTFTDEEGQAVQLNKYFGTKPTILLLGYYECPMLCAMVLNGLIESLQDIRSNVGKDFEVVDISIDPRETPSLAAAKKRSCLKRYGRDGAAAGWHFLTGSEENIRKISAEVGFHYVYDPISKQYAHPSGFVVLTPDGRISRYFFGLQFPARDLYAALQAASTRSIGSRIEQLVLLCFHYRPITSKYGALIMGTVRVLAVATVLTLAWLIIGMARREKTLGLGALASPSASQSPCAELAGGDASAPRESSL